MSLEGRIMSEDERQLLKKEQEKALDNEIWKESDALHNESNIQSEEFLKTRKEEVL